ncbi:uncharacterized protein LOC116082752 isoform X2 [Mastomys coucha]|uniref:uncharacterized protein LOC116082752 isoform X2 n=1 Tax=Mastomys coucha TaxID=35658 RepID=UPI0012629E5F|nr:uncharacterized protein LOC116082752 isoform X2 [Mastomys coucha]
MHDSISPLLGLKVSTSEEPQRTENKGTGWPSFKNCAEIRMHKHTGAVPNSHCSHLLASSGSRDEKTKERKRLHNLPPLTVGGLEKELPAL